MGAPQFTKAPYLAVADGSRRRPTEQTSGGMSMFFRYHTMTLVAGKTFWVVPPFKGPLKGPLEGGGNKKKYLEFLIFDIFVEKLIL